MEPYITKSDIETYLTITLNPNGEALVESLITAVDDLIDTYCNRTWKNDGDTEIVESFDGGVDAFFPRCVPIAEIVKVEVQGSELQAGTYYNYKSYVQLDGVAVSLPQAVKITYKSDAVAIPNAVKQAEIQWVAEMFKSADDAGKVASRVSTGPVSIDFAIKDGMPAFVEKVLNMYRLSPM